MTWPIVGGADIYIVSAEWEQCTNTGAGEIMLCYDKIIADSQQILFIPFLRGSKFKPAFNR